jgi:hypothetical protein
MNEPNPIKARVMALHPDATKDVLRAVARAETTVIEHNMGGYRVPDDPALGPWKLEVLCRVPSFLEVAASAIYGNETVVVRGKTREALEACAVLNELDDHPRLIRMTFSQPENPKSESYVYTCTTGITAVPARG